ncbi:MAG TPA: MFS transporter [Thermoleophilaceae bacterium]|nr:MFS transporter [Thermoleophilaceae bacterium]
MRETFDLLANERRARTFFLALVQSALGTGAGYIALLLLAKHRLDSSWAISLVLLADLIPAMLLGPVFGAVADRWSRKRCAILADVLRVVAFGGIALFDSYAAMIGFAILAGTGTALFTPSVLAALPSVIDDERRLPAASALYGTVTDLGFTIGPLVAAGVLALSSAETLVWVNAASFAMSVVLLVPLRFGQTPAQPDDIPRSLLGEAREGLRLTTRMRAIRVVLLASGAAMFCVGIFNVAELFFATETLGASNAGFGVLVTIFGVGFICGSLIGSKGGPMPHLKRRFLAGLLVLGAGFAAMGLSDSYVLAAVTFAVAGFGNGLVLMYERLLIYGVFGDTLVGRVFGIKDALTAWAFGVAFVFSGALLTALGPGELILIAGGIGVVISSIAALALRSEWSEPDNGQLVDGAAVGLPAPEIGISTSVVSGD